MESNQLHAKEVVTGRDTRRNGERDLSFVRNELLNSPCSARETIFVDLEPTKTRDGGLGCIWNFCKIGHDRPVMTLCDWVFGVGFWCRCKGVVPFCCKLSSGWDWNDRRGIRSSQRIGTSIANQIV